MHILASYEDVPSQLCHPGLLCTYYAYYVQDVYDEMDTETAVRESTAGIKLSLSVIARTKVSHEFGALQNPILGLS